MGGVCQEITTFVLGGSGCSSPPHACGPEWQWMSIKVKLVTTFRRREDAQPLFTYVQGVTPTPTPLPLLPGEIQS